jgi:NAD(P)-dependent dehydrogenase (short-subunit alcohol dehydrogenase family)
MDDLDRHGHPRGRAVVTGGTSGIGRALVPLLAARGYAVVLPCRRPAAGDEVREEVRARVPGAEVEVVPLDLADLDAVRAVAASLASRPLDLLVTNAGLSTGSTARTAQGFEVHWGVMHLAHAALALGVLDALRARRGRLLTVAAYGYRYARLDPATTTGERPIGRYAAYVQAKLAQVVLTRDLALRHDGELTAYSVHPGMVATAIGSDLPPLARRAAVGLAVPPERSAAALARLALDPVDAPNGSYFSYRTPLRHLPRRPAPLTARARDTATTALVRRLTEQQLAGAAAGPAAAR